MNCKICGRETQKRFNTKILNKYDADYFYCKNCGFLFSENPYWLEESYKNPINISDTGIIQRNINFSQRMAILLFFMFDKKAQYLDYAGGYGLFTRMMRDIGFDFFWSDPYAENIFAKDFEIKKNEKVELLTSFESFEHFVEPLLEIEKMLEISPNIFFSTTLLPIEIPAPGKWWYYGFSHGQHVAFYSKETLKFIARKYSLNFYTNGLNLHLLTKKKIFPSFLFAILMFSSRLGLGKFVKFFIKSKTFKDHLMLKNRNSDG